MTASLPRDGLGWSDWLHSRLFERRTLFLSGTLDGAAAAQTTAELMTLGSTADDPVHLVVDCEGGTLDDAFAIIDVVDLLHVPVHVTCMGRAEGPAVGIVACADHRVASPHARFRFVDPPASFEGSADDLNTWVAHHQSQLDRFCARIASSTRQPADAIAELIRSRRYMDAEEARQFRLVDEIATRGADVRSFPRRGLGFRPGPFG